MKLLARLISDFSNPLLISIPVSFLLVFRTKGDFMYAIAWTLLSLLFASLVAIFVWFGVWREFFSDLDVSKKQERYLLFLFSAVITILYFFLVLFMSGPRVLLVGATALLLGIVISYFVNNYIKASIHVAVLSASIFALSILYGGLFWLCNLLIFVVAWARVVTKRHTISETVAGGILGLSVIIVVFFMVKLVV